MSELPDPRQAALDAMIERTNRPAKKARRSWRAKLTADQVAQMRRNYADGRKGYATVRKVARRYGLSHVSTWKALRGHTYRDAEGPVAMCNPHYRYRSQRLCELLQALRWQGVPWGEITAEYGIGKDAARSALKRKGLRLPPPKNHHWTTADMIKIDKWRQERVTWAEIADRLGVPDSTASMAWWRWKRKRKEDG